MGKSKLITALNNVNIYNSLSKGCKVCFDGFIAEKPTRTNRKNKSSLSIQYPQNCICTTRTNRKNKSSLSILVFITSIRGLHVSKSGKSVCCEVEYTEISSVINTSKLYVAFNEDKTALILHSNNNVWGKVPAEYICISDTEIVE